jgi:lactate racemase
MRLPSTASPFSLPPGLRADIISPRSVQPAADPAAQVRTALAAPIGTPPLSQLLRPGLSVAVLVDDITRQTPTALMLPPVLECLAQAGIARGQVCIVFALGTHRPMAPAEMVHKVGADVARDYALVNDSCWDDDRFVYAGAATNGIPAWVNRAVAQSDFRIGLGEIIPHMDAGFSGGAKIVLPGVCSGRTVEAFHERCADVVGNMLGNAASPIRRDLETFVAERVPLDFILNAIPNADGALVRCVAGHFRQAHRAGVAFSRQVYGVPVARRYPLVIANAYPADLDWWQSTKAIWAAELITAAGGLAVVVTACPEAARLHPRFVDYIGRPPAALQAGLAAGTLEDRNAAAAALHVARMKHRIRLGLVSPGLDRAAADVMGFEYFDSLNAALAAAPGPVAVLTHAGNTLPLLEAHD